MDNTVSENNNSQHRSTERVVLILEFLTETENSGKTLTEIANYLNAPKSSTLPILRTLVSYGYLHYNPIVMQYFLGYKLYEIGTKYVGDSNMDDVIFQIMYNFASANDVTLIMGELIAGDVLVVQRVDPFEKLRLYRAVGRRIPAYADAAGKILLAEKSDADVMRLYPEGLTAITPKTITNPSVLFESLDATRQTGVAVSNEESTMYVRSVAVPIKKHDVTCYGLESLVPPVMIPETSSFGLAGDSSVMTVTGIFDARIFECNTAASVMADLRSLIEQPALMIL